MVGRLDDKVAADEGMEEFEFRGFDGVLGLMDTDNV
jgi:hypothetical protein